MRRYWRYSGHGRSENGRYPDKGCGNQKYHDKVKLAGGRVFCESVCRMHARLQVLLRFFHEKVTGHTEEWGTFLDIKHWPEIKHPEKYAGQRVVIGSVTDGYNPQEKEFGNTRKLLEQLRGSGADILICTKSDLLVRDIDLLKELGQVTVSWSINTLDEKFKDDMDAAVSIERRIAAMKQIYDAGIRTVCFVSPVFPGITDFEAIFERVKDQCDLFWLENLNLRGGFKLWTISLKSILI